MLVGLKVDRVNGIGRGGDVRPGMKRWLMVSFTVKLVDV